MFQNIYKDKKALNSISRNVGQKLKTSFKFPQKRLFKYEISNPDASSFLRFLLLKIFIPNTGFTLFISLNELLDTI